mmetsp:Transcript_42224/g.89345  ORF Transcript_42224/g.89345 Transcript_42224/m.89345 type:complete len:793 (-) Transcript_42224:24-2402(-)
MAMVEDDPTWAAVDEQAESDDEDDALHKSGEQKVDFFVDKLGYDATKDPLTATVAKYASQGSFNAKIAVCTAIRAAAEYVTDDTTLDVFAQYTVSMACDPHMRVRYTALLALGQICHDQDPKFHERWHGQFVPRLIMASEDPVDRVAAMALGALEAMIADLDEAFVAAHADPILKMTVRKMQSSSNTAVLEAAMNLLGSMAAGMEGEFEPYYDELMPMFLGLVKRKDGAAASPKLRGKSFECVSLLGYAVGKQRFAPAFAQAMETILAVPLETDETSILLIDYIRDALERMCKVMGGDFAQFLPSMLPGIYAAIRPDSAVTQMRGEEEHADDEIAVDTDHGMMKVNTTQVEEMIAIVHLLAVFIKETGEKFFDFVGPTAQAMAGILTGSDEVMYLTSELRDTVYPCWAELVEVTRKAIASRGAEAQTQTVELVQTFVDKVGTDLNAADDPSDIAPMANGIASVVRNAGRGCLQPDQVKVICQMAVAEIGKSFQRDQILQQANAADAGRTGQGEDDDEEEEKDVEGEEEADCRVGLNAIFGACMAADPVVFVQQVWPGLQPTIEHWLTESKGPNRLLALHVAVDVCEQLQEQAVPIWPVFMEVVLACCTATDTDERQASGYVINLASEVPAFSEYAPRAFVSLGTSLKKFKAKKNSEESQAAQDNIVAGLANLSLKHPAQCPDVPGCWHKIIERMPFKEDTDEGKKTHRKMFAEAQKPNGGNLGSIAVLVMVLGYLAEIYGRVEHCDDDLKRDMARSFASLPESTLVQLVGQMTQKQKSRVERIVQDGRSMPH